MSVILWRFSFFSQFILFSFFLLLCVFVLISTVFINSREKEIWNHIHIMEYIAHTCTLHPAVWVFYSYFIRQIVALVVSIIRFHFCRRDCSRFHHVLIISVIRKAKNNSNHLFLPPRDDNKFDYSYNYHRQYAVRDKLLFGDIWEMKNLYNLSASLCIFDERTYNNFDSVRCRNFDVLDVCVSSSNCFLFSKWISSTAKIPIRFSIPNLFIVMSQTVLRSQTTFGIFKKQKLRRTTTTRVHRK